MSIERSKGSHSRSRQRQQLVPVQYLLPLDERFQQVEFHRRQGDLASVHGEELVRRDVERAAAPAHGRRPIGVGRRRRGRGSRLHPPHHAPDSSPQLAQLERLHDVIVGAHLEAGHAVRQVGGAGDHDDADVVALAQEASEREPVLAGKIDIEQDDVGKALFSTASRITVPPSACTAS